MPRGGKLSEILLAKATEVLNKIIRHSGYNSQELLTNRDQSTGAKLDLSDLKLSDLQWKMRVGNHCSSAKHQSRDAEPPVKVIANIGDIILLKNEKSKHKAREKYFVVNTLDDTYVEVQKITENQIRAKKYKVKMEDLIILKRFNEEMKSDSSEEEYFSAEDDAKADSENQENTIIEDNETTSNKHTKKYPKRLKENTTNVQSTCNFCIENNHQGIHHSESICWRKKNLRNNAAKSKMYESDTETSDDDVEPNQTSVVISNFR